VKEAKIALGEFIKTRENTAKMLDFVHETLDQMPLPIAPSIQFARHESVGFGRDDRDRLLVEDAFNNRVGIIPSICQQVLVVQSINQVKGLRAIVAFATRQAHP